MSRNPTDKYLPRSESDTIEELFRRLARQDAKIAELELKLNQQGGAPLQRIDTAEYPDPFEGQRAIDAPTEQHTWYSNGAWRTPTASIPFCVATTGTVSQSGSLSGSAVIDLNPSGGTSFKTNSSLLALEDDPDNTNTPQWGIHVPANYLALVITSLFIVGGTADGKHTVSWIIDGSFTVSKFGPAYDSSGTSSAFSVSGVDSNEAAPEGLFLPAYLGDTADWRVGVFHDWTSWTNDPQNFIYAISVELIGALPT